MVAGFRIPILASLLHILRSISSSTSLIFGRSIKHLGSESIWRWGRYDLLVRWSGKVLSRSRLGGPQPIAKVCMLSGMKATPSSLIRTLSSNYLSFHWFMWGTIWYDVNCSPDSIWPERDAVMTAYPSSVVLSLHSNSAVLRLLYFSPPSSRIRSRAAWHTPLTLRCRTDLSDPETTTYSVASRSSPHRVLYTGLGQERGVYIPVNSSP